MDISNKIIDIYRKQVDNLIDNLSGYGMSGNLDQEEIDDLWEDISSDLDIDEVWTGISSDLDSLMPEDRTPGLILKSFLIGLIILIGFIPVVKKPPDPAAAEPLISTEKGNIDHSSGYISVLESDDPGFAVTEGLVDIKEPALLFEKDRDGESPVAKKSRQNVPEEGSVISVNPEKASTVLNIDRVDDSDLIISHKRNPVDEAGIPKARIPYHSDISLSVIGQNTGKLKKNLLSAGPGSSMPFPAGGKITAGFITLYKNTWLLNQETFDGLKSETLNTTEFVFFPDAGLSLNYSLSKYWSLQADGFFYSSTGQQYHDYIYGQYLRKKITLRYSTVSFSVKHNFPVAGFFPPRSSVNILAGGYLSFLHHAGQTIGCETENIISQYNRYDFGIRCGGEIEFYINNKLSVAPGIFTTFGMPNIYKGDGNIPGNLRRTNNGSGGFHITFYYHYD